MKKEVGANYSQPLFIYKRFDLYYSNSTNFSRHIKLKYITRTVWILSLVSLFTDAASEMLYPIIPIYLKTIGFSIVLIGVLEGIAEATAGLSKGYFGKLSDQSGKRLPFVQFGYALSAISKPMLAVFVYPLWVFFARTMDRFGKGIRTGARDAMLSEEAAKGAKGKIFGFHRSLDTMGAVLGPAFALCYLYYYPGNYQQLFLIAFVPGCLAICASFFLKEKRKTIVKIKKPLRFFSFFSYWKESPTQYRKVVSGLLAFALFNSSDVFLLLKAKEAGLNDVMVIGLYIFYNLVYAVLAFPIGILADRIGLKKMFLFGLGIFSIVYLMMGLTENKYIIGLLFLLYGMYAAATEGVSKAWISSISEQKDIATAIGSFAAYQSIFAMLASFLAGVIWFQFGANTVFIMTASAAVLIIAYFYQYCNEPLR